ncbi:MAG: DedA family protein [Chloroflexi bacterium]|nr:MAG: DedA family protein [Chloroflexota bacterium]
MKWLILMHYCQLTLHGQVMASLISLETLREALANFGYPAVILFVMIECLGIPFPGETMLLLASFYAAVDHRLQIPIVIICAASGAMLGDNFGYTIGRIGGRPFVERFGRYFFVKPQHLVYAERFFARHGGKTVFLGRFTTLLRLWAAFLAGMHNMHWRTFLLYNAAGGIVWAIVYGMLGYLAGRVFHNNFVQIEQLAHTLGWVTGGIIVIVVLTVILLIRRKVQRYTHLMAEEDQGKKEAESVR